MYGISYLFPDENIPIHFWRQEGKNKRIVLYGAGKVGQSYYEQFKLSKEYNVVLWVDKNYEMYNNLGADVNAIKRINDREFDEVIIAMKDEKVVREVRNVLEQEYGVPQDKILWESPLSVSEYLNIKE